MLVKLNYVPLLLQRVPKQGVGVPVPRSLRSVPVTDDSMGLTRQVTNADRGRDRDIKVNKGCVLTTLLLSSNVLNEAVRMVT